MTIETVVNQAITIPFTFEDDFAALITGKVNADFTKAAYLASTPATTASPTVAAISGQSGDYGVTVTLTTAGIWRVLASCVIADDKTYRYGWNVQVITAAQADPATALAGARITSVNPVAVSGERITLYRGDDYLDVDDRALAWSLTGQPDLTGATVTLTIAMTVGATGHTSEEATGEVTSSGGATQTVAVELTSVQTNLLRTTATVYDLAAVLTNGDAITLARGAVTVIDEIV